MGDFADDMLKALMLYPREDDVDDSRDPIDVDIELIRETEKAVLVTDGDKDVWLPKSRISLPKDREEGGTYTIQVETWLAMEKGLI